MPPKRGAKTAKKGAKSAKPKNDEVLSLNRERVKVCPDCGGSNVIFDALMAQVICHDCGQMFEELPDHMKKDPDELTFL
ncbi:TPA: hypothetical protein HA265_04885 [Candidatus Woesearchaeota archaeon]|nr:hypothetical protein [Candidatus Woesearchaeota archaeon]